MKRAALLIFMLFAGASAAQQERTEPHCAWGLASSLRSASVPYAGSDDPRIGSYVLLLYLDTPYLFLNGTEGGIRLYDNSAWQIAAYGALHFVDMPRHDPDYFSDDTADLGLMVSRLDGGARTDLLLLSDPARRLHAKLRIGTDSSLGALQWHPYAAVGYTGADYNTYYYGYGRVRIGGDAVAEGGIDARLPLTDDIALLANARLRYLGANTGAAATTDGALQSEFYLGAGFFQTPKRPTRGFNPKGYLRVGFGEATPASFTDIISGRGGPERHGLYMASLTYGLPLSKTLFGADVHTYFTPGFVHHFANRLQPPSQEYVATVKFFYRPPGGWWPRFGVGTGLSYISRTTYLERYINAKDGYDHTSHLLQNIDISFDLPLSLLAGEAWRNLWFGYALHHRSGVFESAHQYGQIKGGSNYNMLYMQVHFEP